MDIFPAIDLSEGRAVRLLRGDYDQMTVYSSDPLEVARGFAAQGAGYLHIVDLDGAKSGGTPNLPLIRRLVEESGLRCEIGGGIRSEETVRAYLDAGAMRVILGTIAVRDPDFTRAMAEKYGPGIAVGADIKNGFVATQGWTELSGEDCRGFIGSLERAGVRCVICTDVSRDGALSGTNVPLYEQLCADFSLDIVASGGITTLDDVRAVKKAGCAGAILGKALYAGRLSLAEAIREAQA